MDQPIVERQPVQERLQRRAGRTPRLHHVHMPQPFAIGERHRADVRPRLHRGVVDHQQCRGRACGQGGEIALHALFQRALQARVEGGRDARRARPLAAQAFGQQRGAQGRLQAAGDDRLDTGVVDLRVRPDAEIDHALQHLVARHPGRVRMTVGAQPAGRLRQDRQQGGFGMREARCRFAQVGPAGRVHAFDGATERCALQIERQDLALGQMRFQLHRAQHLFDLAPWRARMPVQHARHLHGQRGTA